MTEEDSYYTLQVTDTVNK